MNMLKKLSHLAVLALICMIFATLAQTSPIKREDEPNFSHAEVSSDELTSSFVWFNGSILTNLIFMNVMQHFLTDKGLGDYEYQIQDRNGNMVYNLTDDIVTKSLSKNDYSFLNEEFFDISSPLELEGMTVLIQRDGNEIGRSKIE
ncbi:756_t:CDS:1 [Cetraspora pellucida]|uniref:756_t:CDS:1 n=1 Tax=Cetraspora pellucida TaxID=1433469 RepID=A0A9N9FPQ3_9GLOM|nr:756_t:CDS:1 [Cetraspora pellucida]